jgi:hypothetical protein
MMAQAALHQDMGRFRGLLSFSGEPDVAHSLATRLLERVERETAGRSTLHILVAVSTNLVPGEKGRQLTEEARSANIEVESDGRLLIQIGAENADEFAFALRLIKFVIAPARLRKLDEIVSFRRLQNRDNFGFTDIPGASAQAPTARRVPESPGTSGATWLLYQKCVQDVEAFFDLSPEERLSARESHRRAMQSVGGTSTAQQSIQSGPSVPILRRSLSYETIEETGLAFVAVGESPDILSAYATAFTAGSDALSQWATFDAAGRGLFVVPPSAEWLRGGVHADEPSPLPAWVLGFKRANPLVLYEVTPSTHEFLVKAFRMNAQYLEEGGTLRPDLALIVRGLSKLLSGHRIRAGSNTFNLLDRIFGPKAQNSARSIPPPISIDEVERELVFENGVSPVLDSRLNELTALAATATAQARAANAEAGEYITFSV